jgi:2-polyprenyl-3-methyl-5-hydroxy-6-metoxy-1,4-benzoquinol methylase
MPSKPPLSADIVGDVIGAYRFGLIRSYCWVRFKILRQRFREEVGQYLPASGRVLDVGCGFGLFALFYAKTNPALEITGIDLNAARIEKAKAAARKLGLSNVHFQVGDVVSYDFREKFDGVYMLDIVHHIPREAVGPLMAALFQNLTPSGRLVVKDVETKPWFKLWWTWWLDKLMDRRSPLNYWHRQDLTGLLHDSGFEVHTHSMVDTLPYPHVLYVCRKP